MVEVKLLIVFCLISFVRSEDLCGKKCVCHRTVLRCKGLTQKDIESDIFDNTITSTLEKIHITDGTIPKLPKNLLGSCAGDSSYKLENLKKLDLQNNDIHIIYGQTLHCMPNLEELILFNNQWNISREHAHVFTSVPNLKKLNMSSAFHHQVDSKVHLANLQLLFLVNQLDKLEVLALDNNDFSVFDKDSANALCALKNLRRLILAQNLLPKVTLYHRDCLPKLEFLDLSYNSIMTFEPERDHNGLLYSLNFIQSSSKFKNLTVNFHGNEFDCDCGLVDFHNWLKRTKVHVLKRQNLYCHDGQHFNKSVLSLQSADFECLSINSGSSSNNAVVGILVTMFVIIALILVVIAFIKRNQIRYFISTKMAAMKTGSLARENLIGYSSVNNENATDIEV